MADLPFFPLATDAYLADTQHLTDAEHGRHLLLLIALWRAPRQRLPNDDAWLARKFGRTAEEVAAELRPIIAEFYQCDGNWITQKRLSREYSRASRQVEQKREAAKSRWRKEIMGCGRNAPTPTPTLNSLTTTYTDAAREAKQPTPTDLRVAELARQRRLKMLGLA